MMNKREWMLQAALAGLNGGLRLDPIDLTVQHLGEAYDAICAATAPETMWVEHDGDVSKAPEEGRMVEAISESGEMYHEMSDALAWDWLQGSGNIVRWRYA